MAFVSLVPWVDSLDGQRLYHEKSLSFPKKKTLCRLSFQKTAKQHKSILKLFCFRYSEHSFLRALMKKAFQMNVNLVSDSQMKDHSNENDLSTDCLSDV